MNRCTATAPPRTQALREGRIILVRHGETEANKLSCFAASNEIPLTESGVRQATELADHVHSRFRPTRVFSSGFRRARQTAEVIALRCGLNVEILPGVEERNFGALKGQPYHAMGAMMRSDPMYDPGRRWLWAPPDGESLEQVRCRALAAMATMSAFCPGEDVVVVSHGAVMETLAAHLSNDWDTASVPDNCAIVLVEFSRLVNSVPVS